MLFVPKVVYFVTVLRFKVVQAAEKIQNHFSIILIFLVLVVILNVKSVNMLILPKKIDVLLVQVNALSVLEVLKTNVILVIIIIILVVILLFVILNVQLDNL